MIRALLLSVLAVTLIMAAAAAHGGASAPRLPRLGPLRAGMCSTPRDTLQRRLCRDVPEVFNPNLGDWRRTSLLREWAYSHIDASASLRTLNTSDFLRRSAPSIFAEFATHKRGVYCGNAAIALLQLYAYFGYDAWTLDVGLPKVRLTHMVTLVRLPDRHGLIAVQGAFLDGSFQTKDGQPLDVREVVTELARGRLPRWVTTRKREPRDLLFANGEPRQGLYVDPKSRCHRTANGWACPTTLFTMARFAAGYPTVPAAFRQMRADGRRATILGIFLYPISVTGPDRRDLLAQLKEAAETRTR